jgi:tetratricopeptide (TPR) repeat protein
MTFEVLPDWYRAAILAEAEAICLDRNKREDDGRVFAADLHLLGIMAQRNGHEAFALECLRSAAARGLPSPSRQVACLVHLGDALCRASRFREALGAILRALVLQPDEGDVHFALGRTLYQQGNCIEAAAVFERVLLSARTSQATVAAAHASLGDLRRTQGRPREALAHYERALALDPRGADSHRQLGLALLDLQDWRAAASVFQQGLIVHPDRADLHAGHARALIRLGALEEAVDACRAAQAIDEMHLDACRDLVTALELLGRSNDAATAWSRLAQALSVHRRFQQARSAWGQVLARSPHSTTAKRGLARIHLAQGNPAQALRCFDAALATDPHDPDTHIDVGWTCQAIGDRERGWSELRWYLQPQRRARRSRSCAQQVWDGAPLEGRTILLWSEPQLGDAIQFLRYAARVAERGGRVIVECDRRLVPLAASAPGVSQVVPRGASPPAFDVHAPMLLLPELLDERYTIPGIPYLAVDTGLIAAWRERLAPTTHKTIGISWAGKPSSVTARKRFTSLAAFAPLATLRDTRFISLQVGPWAAELIAPPSGLRIECLQDESCSLMDTAALICSLDVVISVDTMIAHLSGALARPTWTLLPFDPDWRWPRTGDRTPWYPTMTLFRQTRQGDWSGVLERMRDALDDELNGMPVAAP